MDRWEWKDRAALDRQSRKLLKQEEKLLSAEPVEAGKLSGLKKKLEEKAPEKLLETLNSAFEKGFSLVFESGTGLIEKTLSPERTANDFETANFALQRKKSPRNFRRLNRVSRKTAVFTTGASALEGAVLGLLGIGLPDILVLIAVLCRTVYKIALSYGFSYESDAERAFILCLLCAAAEKGERRRYFAAEADRIGRAVQNGQPSGAALPDLIAEASKSLSNAMLIAKMVQGIPIAGIAGGFLNAPLTKAVSDMARLKYRKRYLLRF